MFYRIYMAKGHSFSYKTPFILSKLLCSLKFLDSDIRLMQFPNHFVKEALSLEPS